MFQQPLLGEPDPRCVYIRLNQAIPNVLNLLQKKKREKVFQFIARFYYKNIIRNKEHFKEAFKMFLAFLNLKRHNFLNVFS